MLAILQPRNRPSTGLRPNQRTGKLPILRTIPNDPLNTMPLQQHVPRDTKLRLTDVKLFLQMELDRLLARRADGIHFAPFEQGEIGPDLFRAACDMMLEGLVSKRRDSRYRPGPSRDWIKVKNPKSPAMTRAKDAFA